MEFKNAYSCKVGLPFEKVTKDGKQYIRQINSEDLFEYSHEEIDDNYSEDPLLALAGYISRNAKKHPNVIIDLRGSIALSNLNKAEFKAKEEEIYTNNYAGDKYEYESYKAAIEKFRGENLFYILVPELSDFYKNEPFIMIPEVRDFILTMHWHIDDVTPMQITDMLYNWRSIHKALSNFL